MRLFRKLLKEELVLDLPLYGACGFGDIMASIADILSCSLDGIAGGQAGGDDSEEDEWEELFHTT